MTCTYCMFKHWLAHRSLVCYEVGVLEEIGRDMVVVGGWYLELAKESRGLEYKYFKPRRTYT